MAVKSKIKAVNEILESAQTDFQNDTEPIALDEIDSSDEVKALQRMLNRISMLTVLQEDISADTLPVATGCAIEIANTIKYLKSDIVDSARTQSAFVPQNVEFIPIMFDDDDE